MSGLGDRHAWELLDVPGQRMAVATLNPDGQPQLTVVWYCLLEDGRIGFTVRADSQKARNLRRDPRVTLMVDAGTQHSDLRGVQIAGRARLEDSFAVKRRIHERIAARYPTRPSKDLEVTMARRFAVIVEPVVLSSWDHRLRRDGRPPPVLGPPLTVTPRLDLDPFA
jgi:PPOX class probable F420-dependent enzyme